MLNLLSCINCIVVSELINLVLVIFFILIGGILPLLERKFLALTQRRVGPKYVGYRGRLQFIADSIKVLTKEYTLLYGVNNFLFFITPVLFININLFLWLNIVWFGNVTLVDIEYTLVFFILISVLSHTFIFITGLVSRNVYTLIASTRVANVSFISELLLIVFISTIVMTGNSFSLTPYKINYAFAGTLLPIIGVVFLIFLVDNGKAPFDVVEAETEVIMGYHVEYGGFLFGLYVLCEYLHVFFFIYVVSCLVI